MYWSGTELPLPDENGIKIEHRSMVSSVETSDGTLRIDSYGPTTQTKRRLTIKWSGLTASEYSTLSSAWSNYADESNALEFKEDATTIWSVNVISAHNSWKESQWYDANNDSYTEVIIVFDEA